MDENFILHEIKNLGVERMAKSTISCAFLRIIGTVILNYATNYSFPDLIVFWERDNQKGRI